MTNSSTVSGKVVSIGVRGKLIGLVLALAAVSAICIGVAGNGLVTGRTKARQSQATFAVFAKERDAYEGWLTVINQQTLKGYQQANSDLTWLAGHAPTAQVRAMAATLRSGLARYNAVASAKVADQTQADFNKLSAAVTKQAAAINASVSSSVSSTISLLRVIGVVGLIIAILITVWIVRSITRPLAEMTEAAERIAEGDVDVEVQATSGDEIGRLAHAFGGSVDYLRQMVDAAGEIAAGNLAVEIEPKSERDALGHAFTEMRAKVAGMIREISNGSDTVGTASREMAQSGQQAGLAVGEIANAVGSVAQGAESQVRSLEQVRAVTAEVSAASQASAADAEETASAAPGSPRGRRRGRRGRHPRDRRDPRRAAVDRRDHRHDPGARRDERPDRRHRRHDHRDRRADQPAGAQRRDRGRSRRRAGPRLRRGCRGGPEARRGVADRSSLDRHADWTDPGRHGQGGRGCRRRLAPDRRERQDRRPGPRSLREDRLERRGHERARRPDRDRALVVRDLELGYAEEPRAGSRGRGAVFGLGRGGLGDDRADQRLDSADRRVRSRARDYCRASSGTGRSVQPRLGDPLDDPPSRRLAQRLPRKRRAERPPGDPRRDALRRRPPVPVPGGRRDAKPADRALASQAPSRRGHHPAPARHPRHGAGRARGAAGSHLSVLPSSPPAGPVRSRRQEARPGQQVARRASRRLGRDQRAA